MLLYDRSQSAKGHENCSSLGTISGCSLHPDSACMAFQELFLRHWLTTGDLGVNPRGDDRGRVPTFCLL